MHFTLSSNIHSRFPSLSPWLVLVSWYDPNHHCWEIEILGTIPSPVTVNGRGFPVEVCLLTYFSLSSMCSLPSLLWTELFVPASVLAPLRPCWSLFTEARVTQWHPHLVAQQSACCVSGKQGPLFLQIRAERMQCTEYPAGSLRVLVNGVAPAVINLFPSPFCHLEKPYLKHATPPPCFFHFFLKGQV